MVFLMEIEESSQAVAQVRDVPTTVDTARAEPTTEVPAATADTAYRCKLCHRGHALRFCRQFRQMSVCHRLRAVTRHNYCLRCLAQSHTAAQCTSSHRCHRCNGDHHAMLHNLDEPTRPATVRHPQAMRRQQAGPRPPLSRGRGLMSRSAQEAMLPIVSGAPLLLMPTVRCIIVVGRQRLPVRGVIDLCAEASRVAESTLRPTGFLRARSNQRVSLIITCAHDPALRLRIAAQVVPHIRLKTPAAEVPLPIRERFRHFRLADETFGSPGPINLVLAGDVYPQLILPGIVQQQGLPIAQETKLGYVLSGAF